MKRLLIFLLAFIFSLAPYAQKRQQRKAIKIVKTVRKEKRPSKTGYTNSSIRRLRNQRAAIQKKIREQQAALKANQIDVEKRLQKLLSINSEIDEKQQNIDGIQKDIHHKISSHLYIR